MLCSTSQSTSHSHDTFGQLALLDDTTLSAHHTSSRYGQAETMPRPPHHSSSSGGRRPQRSDALRIYYCLCGEFVLVCDRPLASLPLRPIDNARILRCLDSPPYSITGAPQKVRKARLFKVSASQGMPKFIKRPDGTLEKQYPFNCSRCNLEVGYEHTPPPLKSGGKFTFLLPGALT